MLVHEIYFSIHINIKVHGSNNYFKKLIYELKLYQICIIYRSS